MSLGRWGVSGEMGCPMGVGVSRGRRAGGNVTVLWGGRVGSPGELCAPLMSSDPPPQNAPSEVGKVLCRAQHLRTGSLWEN